MKKNQNKAFGFLAVFAIVVLAGTVFIQTIQGAAVSLPPAIISYTNGNGSATVSLPSISGMATMAVTAVHIEQGTTTLDKPMDNLILRVTSADGKGVSALIRTSSAITPEYTEWNKQAYNGLLYNDSTGINNMISIADSELRVQKNGTHLTVDFTPTNPVSISLDPAVFPTANFSSKWVIPAFHMDFDGYGNGTFGNASQPLAGGWIKNDYYVVYSANATFSCPAWNNYAATGTSATVRTFNYRVDLNPSSSPSLIPGTTNYTLDAIANAKASFNIPSAGNVTRMQLTTMHVDYGSMGNNVDITVVALFSPVTNGFVELARLSNNPNAESWIWLKNQYNGTSMYSEVNGNVIVNNLFSLNTSELTVQKIGSKITANFNPTRTIAIKLDPKYFPPANFSSTITVPAFHMETTSFGNYTILSAPSPMPSGWTQTNSMVLYATANGTISIPSWNNYSANSTSAVMIPYLLSAAKAPTPQTQPTPNPTQPPTPLSASAFCSVTVMKGQAWNFFVHSLGGAGPVTYQWYEGSTLLAGQSSMILTITKASAGTYTYNCKVTDALGTAVTSNTITLIVV